MNITVKTSKGESHEVEVDSEDASISELKQKLAEKTNVSPEQQRLIFLGRLLEDSKLLKDYKLRDKSAVHLVIQNREKKAPAPGPTASSPQPTSSQTAPPHTVHQMGSHTMPQMGSGQLGQGMNNNSMQFLKNLMGGMQQPQGAGGQAAPGPMNAQQMMGGMNMNTPEARNMFATAMKDMMRNPEHLRTVMDACLSMQNASPETRQTVISGLDNMVSIAQNNPEQFDTLINEMDMAAGMQNLMQQPFAVPFAQPQAGQPQMQPQTQGQQGQQGQVPSPRSIMYSMPFNKEEAAQKYAAKLTELETIGYTDRESNLIALVYSDGDLSKALNLLLDWSSEQ